MAFSTHDIVPDSPTNNFATLNPLAPDTGDDFSMSEGNLRLYTVSSFASDGRNISTIPFLPAMGKIYIEVAKTTNAFAFGFSQGSNAFGLYGNTGGNFEVFAGTNANGQLTWQYRSNSGDFPALNTSATEVIGVLIDFTNSQFKIKLASTDYTYSFSHSSYINFSNTDNILLACNNGGNAGYGNFNFGVDPTFAGNITLSGSYGTYSDANGIGSFYYDPTAIDSDALALCTANLPDPDIDPAVDDLPEDYFKCVKYNGSNSGQTISVGIKPDLVWIKRRSNPSSHVLCDTVRGAQKIIYSDSTNSENTDGGYANQLSSFHPTDGFTFNGTDTWANIGGQTYVAWCWKAGGAPSGSTSTTGSAKRINTSGTQDDTSCSALASAASATITPTLMSINQKAGFSIVKWTGNGASLVDNTYQSIPTGLSGKLAFAIQKRTNTTGNWHTYHQNCSVAHTYWSAHLYLNGTYEQQIGSNYTSQVFKLTHSNGLCEMQNGDLNNVSGDEYISYFFEEVEGYSAFGSYIGNGSADGPFVYTGTGFKPAWVMIKSSTYSTTTYTSWAIYDNARETYNPNNNVLYANKSINEGYRGNATTAATDIDVDFLSNGFKVRSNKAEINQDTETYIFAAFAEQPFKYANAR